MTCGGLRWWLRTCRELLPFWELRTRWELRMRWELRTHWEMLPCWGVRASWDWSCWAFHWGRQPRNRAAWQGARSAPPEVTKLKRGHWDQIFCSMHHAGANTICVPTQTNATDSRDEGNQQPQAYKDIPQATARCFVGLAAAQELELGSFVTLPERAQARDAKHLSPCMGQAIDETTWC